MLLREQLLIQCWCTCMCPSSPVGSDCGSSRLCKRALYSYFIKVAQQKDLAKLPTCYSAKVGVV